MIQFILLVNKQGQTRVAEYFEKIALEERFGLEAEVIRRCLQRPDSATSFFEYRGRRIVYRRYASLYFIVGVDEEENEMAIYEFIHNIVEVFDRYFDNVCELDIMTAIDTAHFILQEMVANGCVVEANKTNILTPVELLNRFA